MDSDLGLVGPEDLAGPAWVGPGRAGPAGSLEADTPGGRLPRRRGGAAVAVAAAASHRSCSSWA